MDATQHLLDKLMNVMNGNQQFTIIDLNSISSSPSSNCEACPSFNNRLSNRLSATSEEISWSRDQIRQQLRDIENDLDTLESILIDQQRSFIDDSEINVYLDKRR